MTFRVAVLDWLHKPRALGGLKDAGEAMDRLDFEFQEDFKFVPCLRRVQDRWVPATMGEKLHLMHTILISFHPGSDLAAVILERLKMGILLNSDDEYWIRHDPKYPLHQCICGICGLPGHRAMDCTTPRIYPNVGWNP